MYKSFNIYYHGDIILGDIILNHATTHEIYETLDAGLAVRSSLLDIPKAFDNVRHEGVQNGISGILLKL